MPLPFASALSFHKLLSQDFNLLWILCKGECIASSSGNCGSLFLMSGVS